MSKVNFRNTKFVISLTNKESRPFSHKKEIVFIGKSNVGKSSLINSLVSQKIAFSSKKAGKTQLLNYFLVDDRFYIVDSPGYGYTAYGNKNDQFFSEMMEPYFTNNEFLAGALLLVDVRRGICIDEENLLSYLSKLNIKTILVFTKCDCVGQKEINLAKKEAALFPSIDVYYSSKNADYSSLRSLIIKKFEL